MLAMVLKCKSVSAAAAAEVAAAGAAAAAAQCRWQVILIDETYWASNIQMRKKSCKRVGKSYVRIVEITW